MNVKGKSQRSFVAVTVITVLCIAITIIAYATILGTFPGDEVQVVSLNGEIKYNLNNSATWSTSLNGVANGSSWYTVFNTTTTGYSGLVNITWQLQNGTGASWTNVAGAVEYTNNFNLDGTAGQEIYCSAAGTQAGNYDWGTNHTSEAKTYRILMTIVTA